jgi:hypothetical protein
MFIGSSAEGLPVAQALQAELEYDVEATIWSQGVFGLSEGNLESLVAAVETFDFAVLVLTADDLVTKRGTTANAPRDNVLFEAGLFMGALGRRKTFYVAPRDRKIELPSDLAGVTVAQFNERKDGNIRAAIGPVALNIRIAIEATLGESVAAPVSLAPTSGGPSAGLPGAAHTSTDLLRLLDGLDGLLENLNPARPGSPLRGDDAKLYTVLLRNIRDARPHDPLLAVLSEPKETALSGVFQMTAGEARTGLSIMRSALMSTP